MRIALIWQGYNTHKDRWRDGLYAAMQLIEQEHEVRYFDFPLDGIHEFKPDVVLYWEAACTAKGKDGPNYDSVRSLPYKKALLFAGGPIEYQTAQGFDLYFVESKLNEDEFEKLGLPWKRAFGVNTQVFRPQRLKKTYDGIIHATFAGWKRHTLFAEALQGTASIAVGRVQEHDRAGYDHCKELGIEIMDEQPPEKVAELINRSKVVVNTSEYWGGGQRCTLEAMACRIPVIVMSDSPKNIEYVQESNAGVICDPDAHTIRAAVEYLERESVADGHAYVMSKWTERHYADSLLEGITSIV